MRDTFISWRSFRLKFTELRRAKILNVQSQPMRRTNARIPVTSLTLATIVAPRHKMTSSNVSVPQPDEHRSYFGAEPSACFPGIMQPSGFTYLPGREQVAYCFSGRGVSSGTRQTIRGVESEIIWPHTQYTCKTQGRQPETVRFLAARMETNSPRRRSVAFKSAGSQMRICFSQVFFFFSFSVTQPAQIFFGHNGSKLQRH